MSKREPREKPAVKSPSESQDSLVTQAARARMARLTGAGVSGLGASTMAFVVGGCLALGYFVGAWFDNRLGTTHWMPIGVFVGLAASVREMFRTLTQLNAQTQRDLASRKAAKTAQIEINRHRVLDVANRDVANRKVPPEKRDAGNDAEPETIRSRVFHVPPPPLASFDDNYLESKNEVVTNEKLDEDKLKKLLREIEVEDASDDSDRNELKSV